MKYIITFVLMSSRRDAELDTGTLPVNLLQLLLMPQTPPDRRRAMACIS